MLSKSGIFDEARLARADAHAVRWSYWLAYALVFVGMMDAISTEVALRAGGAWEANPIIRALQANLGVYWIVPKMALHGMLAFMVIWYPNRTTLVAMTGVAALVTAASVNNFTIYFSTIGVI